MSPEKALMTIMFVDIAKSTQIYNCYGDITAKHIILGTLEQLAQIAKQYKGKIIKTIGDELMISFQSATEAIEAAMEMQRTVTESCIPELHPEKNLNIYIGLESGSVLCDDCDIFGETVNIAARMVQLAKPRQIITTKATVDCLPARYQFIVKPADRINIKGINGERSVYEVVWEEQEMTMEVPGSRPKVAVAHRLMLKYREGSLEIGADRSVVTIGRQGHNDMVVCHHNVSRTHARIEYRCGRFFLIDQSKNGTFVAFNNKEQHYLQNNETLLKEAGIIVLGQDIDEENAPLIKFRICI